jgi:hypothetical protein
MNKTKRQKCRKIYEEHHGVVLTDDIEVHHIVPIHAGGTNHPDNLVALTKEQHKDAHIKRYYEHKDFRDLCSYHMIGYNFTEAHKISSSEGGKIGGQTVKAKGLGICTKDEEKRKMWAAMGGAVGGKTQFENKIGIHAQTKEERIKLASKGGKKGAFTQPEWQSEFGKRGGVKNKGFVWLTDGEMNIKYTKRQQDNKSVDQFLVENPTYRAGRAEKKAKCENCGRVMNIRAIKKYHNERCKNDKNKID